MALGTILAVVVMSMSGEGGGSGAGDPFFVFGIGLACFGSFLSIPILIAKSNGIELTTPHRLAQLSQSKRANNEFETLDNKHESSRPNS